MMLRAGKKAVVLLSGGLDSATTLAIARSQGYECLALSFDYGQRHRQELEAAARIAVALGAAGHNVVKLDLSAKAGFGHSALTDDIAVPKDRSDLKEIPVTYVPARNTIFLSVSLGYAEVVEAFDIFIGVNAIDYSGYPDCRPEFIEAFQKMANLATAAGAQGKGEYKIHTPLIEMSKAQIIKTGLELKVPYELTLSCYDPSENFRPCGHCDSCKLRLEGFRAAGAKDPLKYD